MKLSSPHFIDSIDPGEGCNCLKPEQRISGILEQVNPLHELLRKKKTPDGGDRQSVQV